MKPATTLKTVIPIFALVFGIWILFFSSNVKASGYSGISEGGTVHEYLGTYEVSRNDEGEYKKVVYAETGGSKVVKSNDGVELSNWDKEFVYTDQVGSTSFNLDNNGEITEEFKNGNDINKLRYFAYGSTINSIDTSNLVTADTYTGQKEDTEIDLMYYNARYYDPGRGRFIQADSVNDGLNRYMYVSGNPINANDPSGNREAENDDSLAYYEVNVFDAVNRLSLIDCGWGRLCNQFDMSTGENALQFLTEGEQRDIQDTKVRIAQIERSYINDSVYVGLHTALTEGGYDPWISYGKGSGSDGELNLTKVTFINRGMVVRLDVPDLNYMMLTTNGVMEKMNDDGRLDKYYKLFGLKNVNQIQITDVTHELGHYFCDSHEEVCEAVDNEYINNLPQYLFDDNLEKYRKRFQYSYNDPNESFSVFAGEIVFNNKFYFMHNYPKMYDLIYDAGFYRQGVLPEPNR